MCMSRPTSGKSLGWPMLSKFCPIVNLKGAQLHISTRFHASAGVSDLSTGSLT